MPENQQQSARRGKNGTGGSMWRPASSGRRASGKRSFRDSRTDGKGGKRLWSAGEEQRGGRDARGAKANGNGKRGDGGSKYRSRFGREDAGTARREENFDSGRPQRRQYRTGESKDGRDARGAGRGYPKRFEGKRERKDFRREDRPDFRDGKARERRDYGENKGRFGGNERREYRPAREDRNFRDARAQILSEIPQSVTAESLDADTRLHLRNLNRENAEAVARHLAYAGEMLDIEPETAYRHARAAYTRAARIDVVREALGITAYLTGRYRQALTELRTYRRMSDDYSHVPLEADAERGLGRSEKALRFIEGIALNRLEPEAKIELALVASGAHGDLGDARGGLKVLEKILVENLNPALAARVQLVKADRLAELGREEEAGALRAEWEAKLAGENGGDLMVDLNDILDDEPENEEEKTASDPSENEAENGGGEKPAAERESGSDLRDVEISDEDFDGLFPTGTENEKENE